jgi:hypothetical protein
MWSHEGIWVYTPIAPDGHGDDTGRATVEEAANTVALLDRPSTGKVVKTSGSGSSLTSPFI